MKILFFSLIAVSSCYFGYYSICQLKGREADGAFESLNKIASYADKNDLILLNKEEFTAYDVIKTPLVYFFGNNIFSFNRANDLKFLIKGELLGEYDDLFVLTQLPISEKYLHPEDEISYRQGLFEHSNRIPIKFSYFYFSKLKLLLYKIDKQILLNSFLQKTNAINVKSWFGKKGFYADAVWTKGDAEVFGFEYNSAEKTNIVITTYGWNPYKENPKKLGLKLFVNGAEADFSYEEDLRYYFKIPKHIDIATEIRIKSDTFVPKQLGINNDERILGIDIKTVSFE